jgi:hypothetical protein
MQMQLPVTLQATAALTKAAGKLTSAAVMVVKEAATRTRALRRQRWMQQQQLRLLLRCSLLCCR